MTNYRRLISYIYAYEGEIKGKNIGFAKLESRNGQCKLSINVKKVYVGSSDLGVYLLAPGKEIFLGNIFIRSGSGEFRASVSVDNAADSGCGMEQCYGLSIHEPGESWRAYTTIWEDAVAHAAELELAEVTSKSVGDAKAQIHKKVEELHREIQGEADSGEVLETVILHEAGGTQNTEAIAAGGGAQDLGVVAAGGGAQDSGAVAAGGGAQDSGAVAAGGEAQDLGAVAVSGGAQDTEATAATGAERAGAAVDKTIMAEKSVFAAEETDALTRSAAEDGGRLSPANSTDTGAGRLARAEVASSRGGKIFQLKTAGMVGEEMATGDWQAMEGEDNIRSEAADRSQERFSKESAAGQESYLGSSAATAGGATREDRGIAGNEAARLEAGTSGRDRTRFQDESGTAANAQNQPGNEEARWRRGYFQGNKQSEQRHGNHMFWQREKAECPGPFGKIGEGMWTDNNSCQMETPGQQPTSGETPGPRSSSGEMSERRTLSGETPGRQTSSGEVPGPQPTLGETPGPQSPSEETSGRRTSLGEIPGQQSPSGEVSERRPLSREQPRPAYDNAAHGYQGGAGGNVAPEQRARVRRTMPPGMGMRGVQGYRQGMGRPAPGQRQHRGMWPDSRGTEGSNIGMPPARNAEDGVSSWNRSGGSETQPNTSQPNVSQQPGMSSESELNLQPEEGRQPQSSRQSEKGNQPVAPTRADINAQPAGSDWMDSDSQAVENSRPEPNRQTTGTNQPDLSSQPNWASQPDPSSEPTWTNQPDPSSEPTWTNQPDPSGEPTWTNQPDPSSEPTWTNQPDPSGEPAWTSQPDPSSEPTWTNQPDPSGEPAWTSQPEPASQPTWGRQPQPNIDSGMNHVREATYQPVPADWPRMRQPDEAANLRQEEPGEFETLLNPAQPRYGEFPEPGDALEQPQTFIEETGQNTGAGPEENVDSHWETAPDGNVPVQPQYQEEGNGQNSEAAPENNAQSTPFNEPVVDSGEEDFSLGDPRVLERLEQEEQQYFQPRQVWDGLRKRYPKMTAFDCANGCEILSIKPQDIGLLPRENWNYGNNSFLLHGYYNYRYLILARIGDDSKGRVRYILGVPGHYYSNEKYMASMFGFPHFVLSKKQPSQDGRFGYWYTDVRLENQDQ